VPIQYSNIPFIAERNINRSNEDFIEMDLLRYATFLTSCVCLTKLRIWIASDLQFWRTSLRRTLIFTEPMSTSAHHCMAIQISFWWPNLEKLGLQISIWGPLIFCTHDPKITNTSDRAIDSSWISWTFLQMLQVALHSPQMSNPERFDINVTSEIPFQKNGKRRPCGLTMQ
jgi:hypothetical protein